jgi:hypothetical protein
MTILNFYKLYIGIHNLLSAQCIHIMYIQEQVQICTFLCVFETLYSNIKHNANSGHVIHFSFTICKNVTYTKELPALEI